MSETKMPNEIHRRVFELTLALYRVTDFFPQNEALRKNLREKANEIFGAISEYGHSNGQEGDTVSVIVKIQSIKGFLGLSRSMRFVKPINLAVLEREYDFLANFFSRELERFGEKDKQSPESIENKEEIAPQWYEFRFDSPSDSPPTDEDSYGQHRVLTRGSEHISQDITARQQAILAHLRNMKQAKVSDFSSIFSDISSKTIQRDLQELVTKNKLRKDGDKRWTTYSLIAESLG